MDPHTVDIKLFTDFGRHSFFALFYHWLRLHFMEAQMISNPTEHSTPKFSEESVKVFAETFDLIILYTENGQMYINNNREISGGPTNFNWTQSDFFEIWQFNNQCAAGNHCKHREFLTSKYQCNLCGFACHIACSYGLTLDPNDQNAWNGKKRICLSCTDLYSKKVGTMKIKNSNSLISPQIIVATKGQMREIFNLKWQPLAIFSAKPEEFDETIKSYPHLEEDNVFLPMLKVSGSKKSKKWNQGIRSQMKSLTEAEIKQKTINPITQTPEASPAKSTRSHQDLRGTSRKNLFGDLEKTLQSAKKQNQPKNVEYTLNAQKNKDGKPTISLKKKNDKEKTETMPKKAVKEPRVEKVTTPRKRKSNESDSDFSNEDQSISSESTETELPFAKIVEDDDISYQEPIDEDDYQTKDEYYFYVLTQYLDLVAKMDVLEKDGSEKFKGTKRCFEDGIERKLKKKIPTKKTKFTHNKIKIRRSAHEAELSYITDDEKFSKVYKKSTVTSNDDSRPATEFPFFWKDCYFSRILDVAKIFKVESCIGDSKRNCDYSNEIQ